MKMGRVGESGLEMGLAPKKIQKSKVFDWKLLGDILLFQNNVDVDDEDDEEEEDPGWGRRHCFHYALPEVHQVLQAQLRWCHQEEAQAGPLNV